MRVSHALILSHYNAKMPYSSARIINYLNKYLENDCVAAFCHGFAMIWPSLVLFVCLFQYKWLAFRMDLLVSKLIIFKIFSNKCQLPVSLEKLQLFGWKFAFTQQETWIIQNSVVNYFNRLWSYFMSRFFACKDFSHLHAFWYMLS